MIECYIKKEHLAVEVTEFIDDPFTYTVNLRSTLDDDYDGLICECYSEDDAHYIKSLIDASNEEQNKYIKSLYEKENMK